MGDDGSDHDAPARPGTASGDSSARISLVDDRDGPDGDATLDLGRLDRLARFVLADRAVPRRLELGLLLVDRGHMAELNAEHMGADGPTDVLAFPIDATPAATADATPAATADATPAATADATPAATADSATDGDAPGLLGDVVLCPAVASAQAAERGTDTTSELDLLLVHGILHLLGHDHAEPGEHQRMFGLTDRLLADFAAADQGVGS
ncbi:rRNA maturation RNase YbeY [Egibacter rhizosphaerae]|uniref:rRNA maturation RNase YbeY n=1 Tax=Egibacter rhizosphaerae TaxID=1670831 RepID=UPI00197A8788|nr:rRNA maturation RNase YbeY [Egibacter rhizosphaerae]